MKDTVMMRVAEYIGCDLNTVDKLSKKAGNSYKTYYIPKKNGGTRRIFHPSKETKLLQYALLSTILKDCKIHECAVGYRKGLKSPLRINAKKHSHFPYSVRLDFKEFFPSIRPDDLFFALRGSALSDEEELFLTNALFLNYKGASILTIGAPTSPIICNIIMINLDEKIMKIAKGIDKDSVYTRYADDIFFSTNKKGACGRFYKAIKKVVNSIERPRLEINTDKTIYLSRKNRRCITGLTICPNGNISIGRQKKRIVNSMIFKYKNKELGQTDVNYLKGYLSYIMDVEPDFINRIIHKYGVQLYQEIVKS